jgi:histidinol dehydrogenase
MSTLPIYDLRQSAEGFAARASVQPTEHDEVVQSIIAAVRSGGDTTLVEMAERLDDLNGRPVQVSDSELRAAAEELTPAFRAAFDQAVANIREFAARQMPRECFEEFSPGRKLGWIVRPLDAVGCYVPSGRYPLPSTLLMTAVLAQTAGVPRICVCSPRPSREILGSAYLLGIREVYRIGGAHAIAAMALGTSTIPKVQRIVGPGNAYVATAKKLLAGQVGIDFVAGPTEITILAAEGEPTFIAADMLAQAEHDTDASAVLITTSAALAEAVAAEVDRQLESLPTADVARIAIARNSGAYVVASMQAATELCNEIAPEHLSLHDPELLPLIRNAGTVFLGAHSPESAGDYAAGPSHVLPTGGAARLRGGLSATDFVKVIAVQELTPAALGQLASTITTLARAEGLEAHARAVEVRCA